MDSNVNNESTKVSLLHKFLWYKKFRSYVKVHNIPLAIASVAGIGFFTAQMTNAIPAFDFPIFHNQVFLDFICSFTGLVCLSVSMGSEFISSIIAGVIIAYLLEVVYRLEAPKSDALQKADSELGEALEKIPFVDDSNAISQTESDLQIVQSNLDTIKKAK